MRCRAGLARRASALAFGGILALVGPALAERQAPSFRQQAEPGTLTRAVNDLLNLEACTVASLQLDRTPPESLTVEVPIDGELRTLQLTRRSVRSGDYELQAQLADGSYVNVEPGPVRTYEGTILEVEGSRVAASMLDDGLHAVVLLPRRGRYWIEPIGARVAGAEPSQHAAYHDDDVLPSGGRCIAVEPHGGGDDVLAIGRRLPSLPIGVAASADDTASTENDTWFAELAVDADVEFFLAQGSVEAAEAQINDTVNIVNIQYERDVGIQHTITKIIVRTAEPDPYSSRDPSTLLDQFRNHWYAAQSGVQRDVAHLFTGKVLYNGIAGIAYITGLCSTVEGYSVASWQAPYCGAMACKTDLSAHELGHNWGAGHCDCPGWTMHPVIQSANRFHSVYTVPQITTYRDSRTCLFQGDELVGVEVGADTGAVSEGNTVQLSATALFLYGRDKDVTSEASWWVSPPSAGSVDPGGLFTASEVAGEELVTIFTSYTFDGVEHVGELDIMVTDALAAPSADPDNPDKNRFISMSIPAEAGRCAVRVELTSLHHPVPDNAAGSPAPDFTYYEGQVRWVGPVDLCTDKEVPLVEFRCATLACDPYYNDDWGPGVIHVTGGEIVPSSLYDVRVVPAACEGEEDDCPFASATLQAGTQRFGDIAEPFQVASGPPGTASQPDVLDVAAAVDVLRGMPNAPAKMRAKLWPNAPDPATNLLVVDVALVVDALKGFAYPYSGPCACPPVVPCPWVDYCGRCLP